MPAEFLGQPVTNSVGDRLIVELGNPKWTRLDAAVAFVKMSGVAHAAPHLYAFSQEHPVRVTAGIDQQGTSLEGLQTLWLILGGPTSELYVLQNPGGNPSPTFHPKLWLFRSDDDALLLCGSSNLTAGGLFSNYEAALVLPLTAEDPVLVDAIAALDQWADDARPEVARVTPDRLQAMHDAGELPSEAATRLASRLARTARALIAGVARGGQATSGLFGVGEARTAPPTPPMPALPNPPVVPRQVPRVAPAAHGVVPAGPAAGAPGAPPPIPAVNLVPLHNQLLIQVNPRAMTELYLARAPLRDDPAFFGWPFLGRTTPHRAGNIPQPQPDPLPTAQVMVYTPTGGVAGTLYDPSLKLWTYDFGRANQDFRLTLTGGLLAHVPDGSILVMTRQPLTGADYSIEIYPPAHPQYTALLAACTEQLPNSDRHYGWR